MRELWADEPNLEQLRHAHSLLAKEPAQALIELKSLAERGSVMSMVYIANSYVSGKGVDRDLSKGKEWYLKASSRGSALASYELGRIYLAEKDYAQAENAFCKGKDDGYMPSTHMLGMMYLRGQGVPKNPGRARELLEKAASSGNVFAKRNLGVLLMRAGLNPFQILRGFWLFISAMKDAINIAASNRLDDRLR